MARPSLQPIKQIKCEVDGCFYFHKKNRRLWITNKGYGCKWTRDYPTLDYPSWSWSWSYGSWIYNYLCISPLTLLSGIPLMARCTRYNIMWYNLSVRWFSLGTLVSSTNKTDYHDIADILLKVVLNTIALTHVKVLFFYSKPKLFIYVTF